MKDFKKFLILTILSLTTISIFGQIDCDTATYPKLLNNSFQCKWMFFTIKDTIERVVIKHEIPTAGCGHLALA